ncbi:MAG TPA: hypothetical protein VMT57_01855 [Candidatus Thermoplasmatota archaeon]|nr:hypothetical protein [Candidatus Thermoplasmatota archaeon]
MDTNATPEALWSLPVVQSYLRRQQPNGSWRYPGGGRAYLRSSENYDQIETYRILAELVEKYAMDRTHPMIEHAAEYLFSVQTDEGDFRGIYGTQYTPNYSAGFMELLIKAGYARDARVDKGFRWLLSIRQRDGGWAIPVRTRRSTFTPATLKQTEVIEPDRDRPFSHLVTGVVLRAFTAHPTYLESPEAKRAGSLLASRFFKPDSYSDRRAPEYWEHVSFPFWFTDAVSALDSLSNLDFSPKEQGISDALAWFVQRQKPDGSFNLRIVRGKDPDSNLWICYAICRIFKRFYER